MTRARDDRRRNARREFALYHPARYDDGFDYAEPALVGSFSIGHADGCAEGFNEFGDCLWGDFSETHEPGTHDELHRILVEPRQRRGRLHFAKGIPS